MIEPSPARVRVAGFVLLCLAGVLGAVGAYLLHLALNWQMPPWLPRDLQIVPQGAPQDLAALRDTPLGLAAGYVTLFGAVAGLNALWMLIVGRRSRLLGTVLILMFLVFLGVGLFAALGDGPWRGWGG